MKPTPNRRATPVPASPDAVALLRADHKQVSTLFAQFDKARTSARKQQIVAEICLELSVHTQIEEEIFYPALKQALKDRKLIPEAVIEHGTLKSLIADVENVEPDGEMYDARIRVLAEYVEHHVAEEHKEMFPQAKASKLDLKALGERMAARKAELIAEHGGANRTSRQPLIPFSARIAL